MLLTPLRLRGREVKEVLENWGRYINGMGPLLLLGHPAALERWYRSIPPVKERGLSEYILGTLALGLKRLGEAHLVLYSLYLQEKISTKERDIALALLGRYLHQGGLMERRALFAFYKGCIDNKAPVHPEAFYPPSFWRALRKELSARLLEVRDGAFERVEEAHQRMKKGQWGR